VQSSLFFITPLGFFGRADLEDSEWVTCEEKSFISWERNHPMNCAAEPHSDLAEGRFRFFKGDSSESPD
jgi:hypothetical protein